MALEPGQYQLGNVVFGRKTLLSVDTFDAAGYDVNIQDFQAAISDEMRYGVDSLKPLPIQITIHAFINRWLSNVIALSPLSGDLTLDEAPIGTFAREWRADDVRGAWGELKPLSVCREDGSVVRVYGRPGKLAISRRPLYGSYHNIIAEFRRSDTLAYSDFEWFLHCRPLEIVQVGRAEELGMGDGPSWLRFLIVGPADHPIIQFGDLEIDLDVNIEVGQVVEISSYPWQRRVISLPDGINYNPRLNTPYLDQIRFPPQAAFEVSWTATNVNTAMEDVDFSTYSSGPLPGTDWEVTYIPSPSNGAIEADGTNCVWVDGGNANEWGIARYKLNPSITDYQLVGFTMASPAEISIILEDCVNRIIGRAKSDMSEYTYCDITHSHCWFGVHKNGIDIRMSPKYHIPTVWLFFMDLLQEFWEGDIPDYDWKYECEFGQGADIRSYCLRINDCTIARFSEDHAIYTSYGENYRYAGFGMRATNRLLGQSTPGPLSEWHMRDNPPPELADQLNVSQLYVLWRDAWNTIS